MSSLDVVRSLLRSAARAASSQVTGSSLARAARVRLQELSIGRTAVGEDDLTRAVLHLPDVAAATVRCAQGRLGVDIGWSDGSQLLMAIIPDKIAFAPGGAKELGFTLEPSSACADSRARDVVAAIGSEIARALWRPAIAGAPRTEQHAFVHLDGARVVIDLRDVPEVRWAVQQPLRATIIEALEPRVLQAQPGRMEIRLALRLR